jgi:hypothetical protein
MGSWAHRVSGSWAQLSSWAHWIMGSWAHGLLGSWAHGLLGYFYLKLTASSWQLLTNTTIQVPLNNYNPPKRQRPKFRRKRKNRPKKKKKKEKKPEPGFFDGMKQTAHNVFWAWDVMCLFSCSDEAEEKSSDDSADDKSDDADNIDYKWADDSYNYNYDYSEYYDFKKRNGIDPSEDLPFDKVFQDRFLYLFKNTALAKFSDDASSDDDENTSKHVVKVKEVPNRRLAFVHYVYPRTSKHFDKFQQETS